MPNRILKESICTSSEINNLNAEEERFFYRLIVVCDDFGRMDARPQVLRARCFPLKIDSITDQKINECLNSLEQQNLIMLYEVEEKPYLQMVTWMKHQQKRAKYSKYPAPDGTRNNLKSSDIKCNQMQSNVPEKRSTRNEVREAVPSASDIKCNQMQSKIETEQQKIITAFQKCIYPGITPFDAERLEAYLEDGLDPDVIIFAIEEAANNNARRVAYITSILDRLRDAGITTREAAEADKASRQKSKNPVGEVAAPYHNRIVRAPRGDAASPDKTPPRREDADSSMDAVSLENADFSPGQKLAEAWGD
jgi:DnaD/phage-associated family protein